MGEAPKSASRGSGGIYSLVPILRSNEQGGYKVSHIASGSIPSNMIFPTWHIFDGNFPPNGYDTEMSSNNEYTCIYSNGLLQVFVELPSPKKLLVVVPTYATSDGVWTLSQSITAYASEDARRYKALPMFQQIGGGSLVLPEERATPYKFYRFDIPGAAGYGICLSNLYLFGR